MALWALVEARQAKECAYEARIKALETQNMLEYLEAWHKANPP